VKPGNLTRIITILAILFFYLPIIVVVVFSFNSSKSPEWTGFSLNGTINYSHLPVTFGERSSIL